MKRLLLIALTLALVSVPALAGVSQQFQIQGVLTDSQGVVLPDGDYSVRITIYDAPSNGMVMYNEDTDIIQENGIFTSVLPNFYTHTFDRDTWMELTVYGESPMTPRIPIYPVPVALCASTVDPANAVVSLNGKKGSVTLVGGNNVTVVPSSSSNEITINATAVGGDDGDWEIVGDSLYRTTGRIYVGEYKKNAAAGEAADEGDKAFPTNSKIEVSAYNEGVSVYMEETDTATDGRGAFYGYRATPVHNSGTGMAPATSNAAVTGFNDSFDSYTFGVSAFSYVGNYHNGALLAADKFGNKWSSLVYMDGSANIWGLYSNAGLHTDGLTETNTLRVNSGASAGYIMTSDASGNATWSPPAAATNDGDWTITGAGLYHSGYGAVALGTSTPYNWANDPSATTLQVRAPTNPTLALDAQYASYTPLYRWTLTGGSGGIKFNRSTSVTSAGTTALQLSETGATFNNTGGTARIRMYTEADMDDGGSINLFGDASANPTLYLDGRSGGGGGRVQVCDAAGAAEVIITANHDYTGVGRVITPVLEITGGSDLSEQFDLGNTSQLTKPGMVVSIDPENPGRLALSGKAYDRRVAGVISGAGGVNTGMVMGQRGTVADGELPVALVGRVYVWADASGGPIEPGDLLTTADRPGHAMKVKDHTQATGAILGKAMSSLQEGQGLILTLVTLQ